MALINCPECNRRISDSAVSCPGCGFTLDPKSIETARRSEAERTTAGEYVRGLALLLILPLIVLTAYLFRSGVPGSTATGAAESGTYRAPDFEVWVHVTTVTKRLLRSPSTAKFPVRADSITFRDDGIYVVKGHVDAQNAFGAMLRTRFTCEVKQRPNGTWVTERHSMIPQGS